MVLKEMVVVKFIKMLFVMFLLVFFTSVPVIASETEDYFDEIIYIENQIGAVSIEMHGCLGWFSDDSETVKTASEQAIKDLNEIEDHLLSMNTPKKFKEITDLDIQIISLLKKGYSGIESKDDETIGRESSEFIKVLGKYREAFKEALEKYRFWVKLPEDFDPLNEELMTAGSQEEKLAYKKAIDLMDKRNFKEAYPILLGLKKKAENSSFKDCVLLKISDCLLMTDSNLDNIESMKPDKEGLSILSDIIKKSSYSL